MKLIGGKRCRAMVLLTIVIFTCGVVYFGYFCPDQVCALSAGSPTPQYKTPFEAYLKGELPHQHFAEPQLDRDYDFDIEGEDVIVYLHVQKTGGTTFGRHLVKNIQLSRPCVCYRGRKRCNCTNAQKNIWLFSRYSTGWACGLHADWTELKDCVDNVLDKKEKARRRRRYLYITILRDPVMRYLSEWKHVQRGSTWLAARLRCNGRSASLEEVPFCFTGENWADVSLEEFVRCPHNLANNRLTRMLANMSLVGCYNMSAMPPQARDKIMLQSAKDNLRNLAFFGLTEYQRFTQYMFERTFKLKFIEDFTQRNVTHASGAQLSAKQRELVLYVNRLDIELYQYAKDLFLQRVEHACEEDAQRNITSRLLLPPSEGMPLGGTTAGSNAYAPKRRKGSGHRRMLHRRHKYRSAAEMDVAKEKWGHSPKEQQGVGGGLLMPLNKDGQVVRNYPLQWDGQAAHDNPEEFDRETARQYPLVGSAVGLGDGQGIPQRHVEQSSTDRQRLVENSLANSKNDQLPVDKHRLTVESLYHNSHTEGDNLPDSLNDKIITPSESQLPTLYFNDPKYSHNDLNVNKIVSLQKHGGTLAQRQLPKSRKPDYVA